MRTSRRLLLAALALGTGGIIACVGDEAPTATDDTGHDASTADVTSADGSMGIDAPAADGGSSADTGTDSGVDSGPKSFCNTQTAPPDASDFLCADFDEANFEQGFADASVTDGATLVKDTTLYFSPPNSVKSSTASVAAASSYVFWQRGGPGVVNHITLSAEIKEDFVETLGSPNGVIGLLTLDVGPTVSQYTVAFVYAFNQTSASAGGTFTGYALMVLLPAQSPAFYPTGVLSQAGAFTNVKLDYNGATHRAEVFYDGTSVTLQPYASLTGNLSVQALVGGKSINIGAKELQGQWNIDNALFTASQ